MVSERTFSILSAAIQEFIDSGEPVSSSQLYDRYDFGIRPAMIRFELNNLTEEGYLEQPYHSAGRIPTDIGFEFFARRSLEQSPERASGASIARQLFEGQSLKGFLADVSRRLGVIGVMRDQESGHMYKDGLHSLVEHLEWETRQQITRVIRDFEELEDRIQCAQELQNDDFLNVFIGRKSPITRSEQLAVIAGDYYNGSHRILFLTIGPKRMDYSRIASVFRALKKHSHSNDHE